jgi:hypothetical protein
MPRGSPATAQIAAIITVINVTGCSLFAGSVDDYIDPKAKDFIATEQEKPENSPDHSTTTR